VWPPALGSPLSSPHRRTGLKGCRPVVVAPTFFSSLFATIAPRAAHPLPSAYCLPSIANAAAVRQKSKPPPLSFSLFGELCLRAPCGHFDARITSPVAPSCYMISPWVSPATGAHSPLMNAVVRCHLLPSSSSGLISEPSPRSCCPAQPSPLPYALPAGRAAPGPLCPHRAPHRSAQYCVPVFDFFSFSFKISEIY
jgi:hypothetical protein